jgi:hypothetical protein
MQQYETPQEGAVHVLAPRQIHHDVRAIVQSDLREVA